MTKRTLQKIIHITIGILLLIIGIIGLVIPILNGVIFLILGLILLSFESSYVEKRLASLTEKNKFTKELHYKLEKFLRKIFKQ